MHLAVVCRSCQYNEIILSYLAERYVYSLFGLDLSKIPNEYQGDFEDVIEFRLKLNQMNM